MGDQVAAHTLTETAKAASRSENTYLKSPYGIRHNLLIGY
jgi:hypothetical protein